MQEAEFREEGRRRRCSYTNVQAVVKENKERKIKKRKKKRK